jgi:gliding motility-associated-like protein
MKAYIRLVPFVLLFFTASLYSQCINTFPHTQGFEANDGSWVSGGTANDWAWGTPTHPSISAAGGGTKCWCVGGLSGSFYNTGEQSTLTSPCYDLSTLSYPWLTFKIYWEVERTFDGMLLQYSTNGGTTWTSLGTFGEATNCNTANWFNIGSISKITMVSPTAGWSGRTGPTSGSCQGGSGSNGWVVAKHCLTGMAHQSNVRFRFVFGSGTTCNNYDGIAFDDFTVSEGTPNVANYSYNCTGASSFSFTSINAACPSPATWAWNFGDPASGASNTSTVSNPNHTFSVPGTYSVTMIINGGQCNPPDTLVQAVTVTAATVGSNSPVCSGGTLNLTASGGTSYSWTGPNSFSSTQQNPAIPSVTPAASGTYSVAVTLPSGCIINGTVSVTVNPTPTPNPGSDSPLCQGSALHLTSSGGGTYSWSGPNSFSSSAQNPTITNVTPAYTGTFTVTVTSAAGCVGTGTTAVSVGTAPTGSIGSNSPVCENGTLNLTSSGGSSYAWAGPNSFTAAVQNPSITPVNAAAAGTYTVNITGANGCVRTRTVTVVINPVPVITAGSNSPVCQNTTLNLTSSGGGTYSWNGPNSFTSTAQNPSITSVTTAASGTYTVTVTGANSCVSTGTVAVTVNPLPTVTAASNSPVCVNGTLNLTSTGGGSYSWSGPNSFSSFFQNPTLTNVTAAAAGTYTVTVTAGGCTNTATTSVTVNALPVATAGSNSPVCENATLNLTSSGGGTYSWSGPNSFTSTTQNPSIASVTAAAAGTYTVTVTGASGCVNTATTSVTVNTLPVVTASSNSPVCVNAALNLTSSGGGTYSWNGPNSFTSTSQNPSIASATAAASGTYTVTVTAGTGCVNTATTQVVVNPLPTVTAGSNSPVCEGNMLSLASTGGGSYSWGGPNSFFSFFQNPSIAGSTMAASGTYTVTVTGAGGCVNTATTAVSIVTLPLATAGSNSPVCENQTINLTSSGGGTYSWSGPNSFTSIAQNPSITNATAAAGGTYTVTVTSGAGCSNTATTAVIVNASPIVTAGNNSPVCENATLNLTSSGGSTYSWSGPNSFTSAAQNPSIPNVTAAAAGTYTLTVTGANGCVSTGTTAVTINPLPVATAGNTPACQGATLHLSSSGGGTYSWSGPNSFTSGLQNPSISGVTMAASGTYTVTVTSASGCVSTATTAVTVGTLPTVGIGSNSPVCENSTLSFTSSGGSTYLWTGPNGFTSALQNPTISNVPLAAAGTYTVSVADPAGCASTGTIAVTVNASPAVTAGNDSPICEGASLHLSSSGGLSYSWIGPNGFTSTVQNPFFAVSTFTVSGTYTVTATDGNGCSNTATTTVIFSPAFPLIIGSNGTVCEGQGISLTVDAGVSWSWTGPAGFNSSMQNPSIPAATLAMSGTYTVSATNAFGCVSRDSVDVTVNPLPTVSVANSGPVCEQSPIVFLAGGGVSYSWTGPNGFTSAVANPSISSPAAADGGIYTVTVTDANGCVNTATTEAVINALPTVTAAGSIVCESGTILLTASGGTAYSWSGPGGYSSALQNPSIPSATAAMSGTYTVSVTDANTCVNTQTANVTVNPLPVVNAGSNSPVCENSMLNLNASGGMTYSWSGPNGFISGSQNPQIPGVTLAAAGNYSVTVTDLFGCINTGATSVTVNPIPVPIAGNTSPVCEMQLLNFFSPTTAQQYSWSGPNGLVSVLQNSSIASPILADAGTYTLTVMDINGCTGTATTTVTINPIPVVTASTNNPVCLTGTVQLNTTGSGTFSWNGPAGFTSTQQNPAISNAVASNGGTYTVTVSSALCTSLPATVNVVINPPLTVNTSANTTSICQGEGVAITAAGHGGNNNLTYTWSPGGETGTSISPTPSSTTVYTVTLSDNCGTPVASSTIQITVNSMPVLSFSQGGGICAPAAITFMGNSVPAAASCSWDFGDGSSSTDTVPTHVYETAGSYTVGYTATTTAGCTASGSLPLNLYETPVADFSWSQQEDEIKEPIVYFENNSQGNTITDYNWTLGVVDTGYYSIYNPSPVSYPGAGEYPVTLIVVNQWGCADTVIQIVMVEETPTIYIPTAFSPGGDGVNEYFAPKGVGISEMELFIFDRWGHQLFHSKDVDAKWDGTYNGKTKMAPPDVYIWKIMVVNSENLQREYNGHVTLLR